MTSIAQIQAVFMWMYQEAQMWTAERVKNAAENLKSAITSNLTKNFEDMQNIKTNIESLLGHLFKSSSSKCDETDELTANVKDRFGDSYSVNEYCPRIKAIISNIAGQFDGGSTDVTEKILNALSTTEKLSTVPDKLSSTRTNTINLMTDLVGRNCAETSTTHGLSNILLDNTVRFVKALLLNLLYSFDPDQEFPKMLKNTGL